MIACDLGSFLLSLWRGSDVSIALAADEAISVIGAAVRLPATTGVAVVGLGQESAQDRRFGVSSSEKCLRCCDHSCSVLTFVLSRVVIHRDGCVWCRLSFMSFCLRMSHASFFVLCLLHCLS